MLPEDVVDREAFMDDVVARLLDRHSVVLSAPRRLGKSSVAYEVLRRLREQENCHTAAVDVSTVSTVQDLAERLIATCIADLEPGARAFQTARRSLGRLLRMPEVRARMFDLELSVGLGPGEQSSPEALLAEALALPERIAERNGRPFVLLFDEFQTTEAIGGAQLLAQLRGAFQLQRHTAFLFLGSQAGTMAQLFGSSAEAFYRFATMLDLPPVPDEAWRTYIHRKFSGRGIPIDDGAIDAILGVTGGHPYDTMQVAYEAYLLARRSRRVDARLVGAACVEAEMHLRQVFEAELDALGSKSRVLLGRVADSTSLYAGERSSGTVDRALTKLVRQGVLRHLSHGHYEFVEPMLARHLAAAGR